jgi:polyhydroxyalkanoate synthesis regulator phasin
MCPKLNVPQLRNTKSSAPSGLPPVVQTEDTPKDKAVRAVRVFEQLRGEVFQMKDAWEKKYPDANLDMVSIKQQEDLVQESIKKAKIAVAEAKETIGEFKCQIKKTTAGYNEEELTKILNQLENAGDVIAELIRAGVIENVVINKDSCTRYMARNPQMAIVFKPAWQDSQEMTPAITVPKM